MRTSPRGAATVFGNTFEAIAPRARPWSATRSTAIPVAIFRVGRNQRRQFPLQPALCQHERRLLSSTAVCCRQPNLRKRRLRLAAGSQQHNELKTRCIRMASAFRPTAAHGATITNNLIYGDTYAGIRLYNATNDTIRNNTIYEPTAGTLSDTSNPNYGSAAISLDGTSTGASADKQYHRRADRHRHPGFGSEPGRVCFRL